MKLLTGDASLFTVINDPYATYKQLFQDLGKINKRIYKRDTLVVSQ